MEASLLRIWSKASNLRTARTWPVANDSSRWQQDPHVASKTNTARPRSPLSSETTSGMEQCQLLLILEYFFPLARLRFTAHCPTIEIHLHTYIIDWYEQARRPPYGTSLCALSLDASMPKFGVQLSTATNNVAYSDYLELLSTSVKTYVSDSAALRALQQRSSIFSKRRIAARHATCMYACFRVPGLSDLL